MIQNNVENFVEMPCWKLATLNHLSHSSTEGADTQWEEPLDMINELTKASLSLSSIVAISKHTT